MLFHLEFILLDAQLVVKTLQVFRHFMDFCLEIDDLFLEDTNALDAWWFVSVLSTKV